MKLDTRSRHLLMTKSEALCWIAALALFLAGMGTLFFHAWMIARRFV